jgi:putative transposase
VNQKNPCCSEATRFPSGFPEAGVGPAKLTGAFERFRQAVSEEQVAELLQGRAAFSRRGPLSAWVVIWLMIFQRLDAKGTLSAAVRHLLTGPVRALVQGPEGAPAPPLSASTSAYSQARGKLPLEVAEQVSALLFESLQQQQPRILPGLEQPMFLLDGSSILLAHSPESAKLYPPQRNQHGDSHWPVLRVVVAHDLVSGLATPPCWGPMNGPQAVSEQGLAKDLLRRLPAGCGVLGDCNFGVFSVVWHAAEQNHPVLLRLTEARARKVYGRGIAPPAKTDKAILWSPSRADRRNNPELPATASAAGRLLTFKVRNVQGKRQKLYFFTTFTVPSEQILRVYGYRWNIETDLRSLKREVRLHMPEVKSPAMAARELVLGVAAYHLTRAAIDQAAAALHLDPRRFSFSLAQETLNAFLPAFAQARSEQERQQIMQEMLRVFRYSTLPQRRKRPSAPRAVWPRPRTFPKRKVANRREPAKRTKGVA